MQRMRHGTVVRTTGEADAVAGEPPATELPARPADVDALGRACLAARATTMAALQAGAGNAAVLRMLDASPRTSRSNGAEAARGLTPRPAVAGNEALDGAEASEPGREVASGTFHAASAFTVDVARGPAAADDPAPEVSAASADRHEGDPTVTPKDVRSPGRHATGGAPRGRGGRGHGRGRAAKPSRGARQRTVTKIPDVVRRELHWIHASDAIVAAMPYTSTIAEGAPALPGAFGVTRYGDVRVSGLTVTSEPELFRVQGTVENRITWSVRSLRHIDIAGAKDSNITARNYRAVAKDLTPNMSDLGGRPPRERFWARDLTTRHELFHAHDVQRLGPGAVASAVEWLSSVQAESTEQVAQLVGAVPSRVLRTIVAAMGTAGERRAYGDGAPLYRKRAKAIRARGKAGKYK